MKFSSLLLLLFLTVDVHAQEKTALLSKEEDKSKSSMALISSNLPYTKEQVLGNILKGALENMHFVKKKVNDDLSKGAFKLFIERIDYGKQFLLQDDVNALQKYEKEIDDQLKNGNLVLMNDAQTVLKKRITMLEKYVEETLKKPFDFSLKETFETDAKKRKFVKTEKELQERWRKMLKLDVLSQYLELKDEQEGKNQTEGMKKKKSKEEKKKNGKDKKEVAKKVLSDKELEESARDKVVKRYQRIFKRLVEERRNDNLDKFYNSIARVFDPHTQYLIPEDKEDFDIDMSGKLEGIGALLREENSYIKVERIIPGSASWKGKDLKEEDIILAVGQGNEEPVDIVDMNLRDAVKLIRGPKGTTVKLTVKRPDGSTKVIPIVRDEVVIEESYVKSSVLEHKEVKGKIGYIYVPKFYRDFNDNNGRNCSDDVKTEIEKLKKQDVKGIILDLRNNGGGALEDAKLMSGLFIKKGPIVQVKASTGGKDILEDTDGKIFYKDPVIVLVNRFSASASEIVAAALQDYGRAIVVGTGDQTHGKGTVQAVVGLDGYVSPMAKAYAPFGALKITIQMFYRITGGSTQFRGVEPDIKLPDEFEYMDSGEKSLDYAIPYGSIDPVKFEPWKEYSYDKKKLVQNSAKRIQKSDKFKKTIEATKWYQARKDNSERSLVMADMIKYKDEAFAKSEEFIFDKINKDIKVTANQKVRDEVDQENVNEFIEKLQKDPVLEETLYIFNDILSK
jgi:carboxyl-terminal processing protease